jgi:hypothetical protein
MQAAAVVLESFFSRVTNLASSRSRPEIPRHPRQPRIGPIQGNVWHPTTLPEISPFASHRRLGSRNRQITFPGLRLIVIINLLQAGQVDRSLVQQAIDEAMREMHGMRVAIRVRGSRAATCQAVPDVGVVGG